MVEWYTSEQELVLHIGLAQKIMQGRELTLRRRDWHNVDLWPHFQLGKNMPYLWKCGNGLALVDCVSVGEQDAWSDLLQPRDAASNAQLRAYGCENGADGGGRMKEDDRPNAVGHQSGDSVALANTTTS